jgi:hypothetical protein
VYFIFIQAVAEVVDAGPNAMYKPGQPVMYLQYGAFSDYKVKHCCINSWSSLLAVTEMK